MHGIHSHIFECTRKWSMLDQTVRNPARGDSSGSKWTEKDFHFIKQYLEQFSKPASQEVACTVGCPNRHVLEILLSHRHTLVVQNRWASVRLHHCSNKLLPFNIKSINPYKSIYTLLNCVLVLCKYLLLYFFSNEFSNFFWIMFNSKAIKVCCIFSIHICYSI